MNQPLTSKALRSCKGSVTDDGIRDFGILVRVINTVVQ